MFNNPPPIYKDKHKIFIFKYTYIVCQERWEA